MTIGFINGIIQEVVVFLEKHGKTSSLKCYHQINIHQKIFKTICQPFLAFCLLQRLS